MTWTYSPEGGSTWINDGVPQMFAAPLTIHGPLLASVYGRWVSVPAFVVYGSIDSYDEATGASKVYVDQNGNAITDPTQNPIYGGGIGGTNFFLMNPDGSPGALYGSVSTGSAHFGGKFLDDYGGYIALAALGGFAAAGAGIATAAAGAGGGVLTAADEAALTFGTGDVVGGGGAVLTAADEAALTFGTGNVATTAATTVAETGGTLTATDEAALTFGTGNVATTGAELTATDEAALTFGTGNVTTTAATTATTGATTLGLKDVVTLAKGVVTSVVTKVVSGVLGDGDTKTTPTTPGGPGLDLGKLLLWIGGGVAVVAALNK